MDRSNYDFANTHQTGGKHYFAINKDPVKEIDRNFCVECTNKYGSSGTDAITITSETFNVKV